MNWLAHIFLSEDHIAYQHGNLLADLLKGRAWRGAGDRFRAGLEMHRAIDGFTDTHPLVGQSKARLGRQGRLRGVAVDVIYDHLLAKHWSRYSDIPLEVFVERFHRRSLAALSGYPGRVQTFLCRLAASRQLMEYASFPGVVQACGRIDRRLSPRLASKETLRGHP